MLTTYSRRRRSGSPLLVLSPLALLVLLFVFQLLRTPPPVTAAIALPATTTLGEARSLPFPLSGTAAVAVPGLGTLGAFNDGGPRPIASITKMMTAYVIMKGHPLQPGQRGETYTISAADVAIYNRQILQDQSTVPVTAGTQFTLYELLQALLVPSANNIAETLAVWDAGSLPAFVAKMNAEAAALGMRNTTYADASGFSINSRSTAADQLVLAQAAMELPVFAEIVGQSSVRLPGGSTVSNVNTLLGQEGIAGIKTGFTEEAGGCLAFFARKQVGTTTVEVFGVVLGQPTRAAAFEASRRLVNFAGSTVQSVRVVTAGQTVATLDSEWGGEVNVVAATDVSLLLWPGSELRTAVQIDPLRAPLVAGAEVGQVTVTIGEQRAVIPVQIAEAIANPGVVWRLSRF